jgi:two-component system, LuxR family, response regulator FixJ
MDTCPVTVFIVDDDAAVLHSLSVLVEEVGLHPETFASAQAFLDTYDPARPGCLVLDVRMPGISGLDLQGLLKDRQAEIPIVMISGHGDIPMAVQAVRGGAVDFLEKPFRDQEFLDAVQRAVELDRCTRETSSATQDLAARMERLTGRQRQIMDLLVSGKSCKAIAHDLGISPKTVDYHRGSILETMGSDSIVELAHRLHANARPTAETPRQSAGV